MSSILNKNIIKFVQKQKVDKENNSQILTVRSVSNSNCEHLCFAKKLNTVNKSKKLKTFK